MDHQNVEAVTNMKACTEYDTKDVLTFPLD